MFKIYSSFCFKALFICSILGSVFLAQAQSTSWTGTNNIKWSNSSNWTNGVPNQNVHAIIGDANFTGSNQPELDGSTAKCLSLTIGNGSKTSSLSIEKNIQIGGNVLIGSNGTILADKNNRKITLEGNWINNGSYAATTSSAGVVFSGINVTLSGATTFEDLTINSGTTLTLASDISVEDDLEVSGVLNPTASFKVSGGGELVLERNGEIQVFAQYFSDNYNISSFDIDDRSTVNYASASITQYISSSIEYGYLQISGGSTKELTADLPDLQSNNSASGRIYLDEGVLDLKTFTADRSSGSGGDFIISNDAELWIGGTNSFPDNYDNLMFSSTSLVRYYGNDQTVIEATYGHLELSGTSGSVVKTLPNTTLDILGGLILDAGDADDLSTTAQGAINVEQDVEIGENCTFNAASFTHSFNAEFLNEGTFTGSSSTVQFTGVGAGLDGGGTTVFNNILFATAGIYASSGMDFSATGNIETSGGASFTHESGGEFTLSGSAKTVDGSSFTFSDLVISGSITTSENLTISGDLLVDGSFSASNNSVTLSGASSLIYGSGAISFYGLNITGTVGTSMDFDVKGNFTVSITSSFTASAGDITFNGTTNFSGHAIFYDISVASTKTLNLGANAILDIENSLSNSGTFNANTLIPNTVRYIKSGAQAIANESYYNLILGGSGTKTLAGATSVYNDITINSGVTLNGSTQTLSIYRHWNNIGSFTASTSDVHFRGSNAAIITGATTFKTLTINKASDDVQVSFANDHAASNVVMTQGYIATGTNKIVITSNRTGNGIIIGTIEHNHSFSNGTTYYFEGPNNGITFYNPSSINEVTVTVAIGEVANVDPTEESLTRSYDVDIPSGTYDSATMRFHYEDNELNAFVEPFLAIYKYVSGTNWDSLGFYSRDVSANYVELGGFTNLDGTYMLAGMRNIVRWTGAVSSAWNNASNWTTISGQSLANRVPDSTDVAQIGEATFTNQPSITTNAKINVLRFGSAKAATLSLSSGSLEVIGSARGNWSTNRSHTLSVGSGSIEVGTSLTLSDGIAGHDISLEIGSGTTIINYDLIHNGTGSVIFLGNGNLDIGHTYEYTSGIFTPGTGTVTYIGGVNQEIAPLDYYNLTIDKTTARARLVSPTKATNDFATATGGELALFDSLAVGGDFTIGSSTEVLDFNAIISVGGDWANNGTFTATGGSVIFNGAVDQDVNQTTFNNLLVNKANGVLYLTANLSVNNNLDISQGTMDLETYTSNRSALGGELDIRSDGILKIAGTSNFPSNFLIVEIDTNSSVEYDGTVAQTINPVDYGNLSLLNGSPNAKTCTGNISILGDLSIGSTAVFAPDTNSVTLYGDFSNSGTFTPGASTLVLQGVSKNFTGTTTLNNLTVLNGSYTMISGDLSMAGNFFIENTGSFSFGSNDGSLDGDLTNRGTLISNGTATFTGTREQQISLINAITSSSSGVINFNGSVEPVISSSSSPTFATVNINNTAGITPSVPWTVLIDFNVASGATFNGGALTHTFRGGFTNAGTVNSTGKLLFNPGSPYSSSSTITLDGTSFISTGEVEFGGTVPITLVDVSPTLSKVIVSNSDTSGITPASSWLIEADLQINSGSVFKGGSATDHKILGNLVNNGTFNGQTSNVTFDGDTSTIEGNGINNFNNITIGDTTQLTINNQINVYGDFINDGEFIGPGRTVNFTGSKSSTISGASGAVTFDDLATSKSDSTTTLEIPVTVISSLTLTSGTFTTDATNILTLTDDVTSTSGSSASFVNGPMTKIGDEAFVFPVGKGTFWARLGISAPSNTTDAFTAEYFDQAYANTSTMAGSPSPVLNNVSTLEYWTCDRTTGSSNVNVSLYWENASGHGINSFSSDLVVARWNGSGWENAGQASISSGIQGNVTSNTVSSFSPFTFGSLSGSFNPVPVELLSFSASLNRYKEVDLIWTTASEINNDYFDVQRSSDGEQFETIDRLSGAGTSNNIRNYSMVDHGPLDGLSYYRLKQVDFNGAVQYSDLQVIENFTKQQVLVYPNPARSTLTISYNDKSSAQIEVFNSVGVRIYSHEAFDKQTTIDITEWKEGVYFVNVILNDSLSTTKIIKSY